MFSHTAYYNYICYGQKSLFGLQTNRIYNCFPKKSQLWPLDDATCRGKADTWPRGPNAADPIGRI